MKCLNVLRVKPLPFMTISLIMCVGVKFWKRRFSVVWNNSSDNY